VCPTAALRYQARSHTGEKDLLPSSRRSIRPDVSARCPLERLPWNFKLGTLVKLSRETPNVVKTVHKYLTLYMKTQVRGINDGDINTPWKHFWQHLMFLYYWQWHAPQ